MHEYIYSKSKKRLTFYKRTFNSPISSMDYKTTRGIQRNLLYTLAVIITALCSGCSSINYYTHLIGGHLEIHSNTQPIKSILENPKTEGRLAQKLRLITEAKSFAETNLALPKTDSYTQYANIGRDYVMWSVTATPKLSLSPYQSCFIIVGCMSYRTFFAKDDANEFAKSMKEQGYDTYIGEVAAFSSLGWFDDPVLNTMLKWPDTRLAGLIFHELTHQKIYVNGDTAFNESVAVTVEIEGIKQWLQSKGQTDKLEIFLKQQQRRKQFLDIVLKTRSKLKELYQSNRSDSEKIRQKQKIFKQLLTDYYELKHSWNGYSGYDRWFNNSLNNAKLALLSTYTQYVPDLTRLLHENNSDFGDFFQAVNKLAGMKKSERKKFISPP